MSLINDALKKAQRQRGDAPPAPNAPSAAPMPGPLSAAPSRNTAPASRPQLLLFGGGAALGLLLALGAFFLLRSPAPEPSAIPTAAPATADTAPTPTPLADNLTQTAPTSSAPVTIAPPASPVAAPPTPSEETLLTVSTLPPAPELPKVVSSAADGPPPSPSLQMISAIEGFRIAGVRAAGTDSKVLMNDRVYRVGDVVDHVNGIRIAAVTANSVTFTDRSGASYTRNF